MPASKVGQAAIMSMYARGTKTQFQELYMNLDHVQYLLGSSLGRETSLAKKPIWHKVEERKKTYQ